MADTTVENVLAIAGHLEGLDNSTIQLFIDDAIDELSDTELADNERAQRYLAAHYGTLRVRRAESEDISGAVKVTYNTPDGEGLKSTVYGEEVERIMKRNNVSFRLFS